MNNFDDDELDDPHLLDSQDFDDNLHMIDESNVNPPEEMIVPNHSSLGRGSRFSLEHNDATVDRTFENKGLAPTLN